MPRLQVLAVLVVVVWEDNIRKRYLHHRLSEFGRVVDLRVGPPINLAVKSFSLLIVIRMCVRVLLVIKGLTGISSVL